MDDWAALNERQRAYIHAIYASDQEAETEARAAWSLGVPRGPADAGRCATPRSQMAPLKMRLRRARLVDAGTGATLEALERRGYI